MCLSRNRVLIVDIDPVMRSRTRDFLFERGQIVAEAANAQEAEVWLRHSRPAAMILDFSLPNGDAIGLLNRIKGADKGVPVIALVSHGAPEVAIRAIQSGAEHLLMRPVEPSILHAVLLRTLSKRDRETNPLPGRKVEDSGLDPFLGTSSAIRRLRDLSNRVADSQCPVLLQGETGSGKGVLANWIHRRGPRASEKFLDLNCAGLSRELLESELFGHEKGAFTSALSAKQGLLETADRGTVFLDEIGDIDLQVQPKLLKVLEDKMFRRLGDTRDRSVDIRLISATHRELLELVRQNVFRSDLYFRMNIVPIKVPPLRERVEDIPVLVEHLTGRLQGSRSDREITVDKSAMELIQRYSWPGNIRELRNVLERGILLAEGAVITGRHLQFQQSFPAVPMADRQLSGTLCEMESSYISFVLGRENGSVLRTAQRLGIGRSSLYAKMKRHNIPVGTGRGAI